MYKEERELLKSRNALKALESSCAPPGRVAEDAQVSVIEDPAAGAYGDESNQSGSVPTEDFASATGESAAATTSEPDAAGASAASASGSKPPIDKLLAAKAEADTMARNWAKSQMEKETLTRAITLETQLHREIFRWMQAMQELLWPSSDEQVALGRPVGPASGAINGGGGGNDKSVLEYNRGLLAYLSCMLPIGVVHMQRAATLVGIAAIEDVLSVLEAFKWMSWINLCLHFLRFPPTTPALKKLLDAAKPLRYADDKIIKALTGVLQRAR
jgi:hypothetical protein